MEEPIYVMDEDRDVFYVDDMISRTGVLMKAGGGGAVGGGYNTSHIGTILRIGDDRVRVYPTAWESKSCPTCGRGHES